ncbi:TetR/AcrR family transcriptional regulator [Vicingaceae bacterium]|jgi:AcrR family transcriptional regulator|nr:TetR/AcrR family transcriptional regulator [Vicingaceae bacterium]
MENENEKEKSCQLIGTCLDLFMKFGIKSLTMDDISRKLGISKKTLYQFVKDKKDLVNKGMKLCLEEEQSVLTQISSDSDNAIDELIGFTRFVNSRLSDLHASVIYDIQKYHPDSWTMMEDHKKGFVRLSILENTERGIREGLYRDNLNSEIVASLYMLMMDGFFQSEENFGKDARLEDLHLEMIRYHVRGIANEKGITLLKESLNKEENNHLNLD